MYDRKSIFKILEYIYKNPSICSIKGEDLHYILKLGNNYIERGSLKDVQFHYIKRLIEKNIQNINLEQIKDLNKTPSSSTSSNKYAELDEKENIIIKFGRMDGDEFEITKEQVKSLPGRRWRKRTKEWVVPLSVDAIYPLINWNFKLGPLLHTKSEKIFPKPPRNKNIDIPNFRINLYPFQEKGVLFVESRNGRVLISDQMGLGKTLQSLGWAALHPEIRPVVIVVPASIKLKWQREINKAIPNEEVHIIYGRKETAINSKGFIILNYDIINYHEENLKKINPQLIILDEVHKIKNENALRTIATKSLAKNIKHIIALSGTPIENKPLEFFSILNLLNPELYPSYWHFVNKYCIPKFNGFGWDYSLVNKKKRGELHDILTKTVMIRRLKKDVLKDLPDKTRSIVPIEVDNKKEYKEALIQTSKSKISFGNIEELKQIIIKGKMKKVTEWIDDFIEGNEKLIIFCVHHWTIDTLMEKYKKIAVKLDGRDSLESRQKAVDNFQLKDDILLFIANIQAGGEGIDLYASSNVAFVELGWKPSEHDQAEDRSHRIGQKNAVNAYYLIGVNTIEETIMEVIDEKRNNLDMILNGEETEESSILSKIYEKIRGK